MTEFEFYLNELSFEYIDNTTIEDLNKKIEQLSIDCDYIKEQNEKIFKNESIYDVIFFENLTLVNILYSSNLLNRDQKFMLETIIDHSKETNLSNWEIINLLPNHNEELVRGFLAFNETPNIDKEYIVYDKNDWFNFHHYFLSIYPISEENFFNGLQKYFPNLFFHEDIKNSLKTMNGGLNSFAKTIIEVLKLLDKFLKKYVSESENLPKALEKFSSESNFETTLEGDTKRKKDLTFNFQNKDKQIENIYCEPHIKLSKSDLKGNGEFYYNRIYFHIGKENIENGKILIGYIGKHL